MPVDPALVALWAEAWARSRGVAPPVARGNGLYVGVGLPGQVGRYVFPTFDADAIAAVADAIHEPEIFLKILAEDEQVVPLLPPRWSLRPPGYMMAVTLDAMTKPHLLPSGCTKRITEGRGVSHLEIITVDGTVAADGRATVIGDVVVFDRIVTNPLHGRRGLGSVVMGTLASDAVSRGATRGLLVATPEGRALYSTLGWSQIAPYCNTVIEPPR